MNYNLRSGQKPDGVTSKMSKALQLLSCLDEISGLEKFQMVREHEFKNRLAFVANKLNPERKGMKHFFYTEKSVPRGRTNYYLRTPGGPVMVGYTFIKGDKRNFFVIQP